MYNEILVPTDGSATAGTAAETALDLAQRFDASLHAISVAELDSPPTDVESEVAEAVTQHGEATLAALREQAASAGVPVTASVIETADPVHQAIIDYVNDHGVDLVVMGTHGRTGLNRFVLGSVTERTLRTSPVPVLTVHEDAALPSDFGTILVPTDRSEPANRAADHGVALAEATGAAMDIIHVVDLSPASGDFGSADVLTALEDAGQRAVDDVIDRAKDAGLEPVVGSVLTGTPAQGIVDYVQERDVDLIVMGTHGRTGLKRYFLGSLTEKIVRVADAPVLTVSQPEEP